jgi:hypothetical protein
MKKTVNKNTRTPFKEFLDFLLEFANVLVFGTIILYGMISIMEILRIAKAGN